MFEFYLPIGAIIEILGNRYFHIGEGKFTGLSGNERPSLIEAVSNMPELQNDTVVLMPHKPCIETPRYRVIFFVGTSEELEARKAG